MNTHNIGYSRKANTFENIKYINYFSAYGPKISKNAAL
jgi:hypothetical protein